jgi:hypothetical protein
LKKSFRDPNTDALKAWGYMDSNAPGDVARDEPDDFDLEPGQWKFEGGQWVTYAPTVIPQSVSPLQARKALKQQSMLTTVQAAVAAADEDTQMAWEYATSFDRTSPFVSSMAAALGWTDEQVDQLFILANSL